MNDFLPRARRQVAFGVRFSGPRSVKDVVEGAGVPHAEIDVLLLNGESVAFDSIARDGDRVAVFPRFESIDVSDMTGVPKQPYAAARFVVDGHLGTLVRWLRLLGADALSPPGADDGALAALASREGRVLLTRDRGLLKRRVVTHGYFVRETDPRRQAMEVLRRYDLAALEPFSRCLPCNGLIEDVAKSAVEAGLPRRTRDHYEQFRRCAGCGRVYWKGSHWARLVQAVDAVLEPSHGGRRRPPAQRSNDSARDARDRRMR